MRSSLAGVEEYNSDNNPSVTLSSGGFMPDLFSSLEYNIRMGSGLATVQSAKEPVRRCDNMEITCDNTMIISFFRLLSANSRTA